MGTRLPDVLQSLESSGLRLDRGSKLREWVKHLYVYVDSRITPLLKSYNSSSELTSDVVIKAIEHLKKDHPDGKPSLPIKSKPISVSQVKTFSQPKEFHLAEENYSCVGENLTAFEHENMSTDLTEEPKFLIGVLSSEGYIKKHLYISDASGLCMCHISNLHPWYAGSVVLIPKWRFIPPVEEASKDFQGYIEVFNDPIILISMSIKRPAHNLPLKSKSSFHSVSGCVTNISSCLTVSRWYYTIAIKISGADVGSKAQVMIVNPKFAFWVSCIHDGCEVTIHMLKRIKIRSGQDCYNIMSTTLQSELVILKSAVTRECSMTIIQNPGLKHGDNPHLDHGFLPCYVGKITKVLDENFAMFSLDEGKVILHGCYLLWEDAGRAMREGAVISVTSAHVYKDGDDTSLHVICCALSSVQIIRQSPRLSPWLPVGHRSVTVMTRYLNKDAFLHHPRKLLSFLELLEKLCETFSFLSRTELISCENDQDSILKRLLFEKGTDQQHVGTMWKRDMIKECLSPQHSCIFTRSLEKSSDSYYLMNLAELQNVAIRKAGIQYQKTEKKDYWMPVTIGYQNLRPDQRMEWNRNLFLLGCVMSSDKTGRIHLCDNSGSIEFLCLGELKDIDSDMLCTDLFDCFVQIKKFAHVVECTLNLCPPTIVRCSADLLSGSESEESNFSMHSYIVCSLQDVKILKRMSGSDNRNGYRNEKSKTPKESTITGEIKSTGKSTLDELIQMSSLDIPKSVPSHIDLYVFIIDLYHSPNFTAQALLLRKGDQIYNPFEMISIRFTESLRWKPFVFPGKLLKISMATILFNLPLNITKNCIVEPYYGNGRPDLPSSLVNQARSNWKESFSAKCLKTIYSVSEIATEQPTSQFTFRGVIKFRKAFIEKDSLLQRLQISDEKTTDSICLYLGKMSNSTLPSGMTPGAVIMVAKAKLFQSAKGNMYMKYHPGMMISIMSLPQVDLSGSPAASVGNASSKDGNEGDPGSLMPDYELYDSSLPTSYLYHSYINESLNTGQVLKLDIFPVKISNAFIDVHFYEDFSLSFSCKCLVDDNTSQAILNFNTRTVDDFFRFIDVDADDKLKFLEMCRNSTSSSMKYYHTVYDGENEVLYGKTKLDPSKFDALAALIVICNAVNTTAIDSKMVIVKQVAGPKSSTNGGFPAIKTGTVAVGSQELDHLISLKLELLYFECIKVL